jgi:hypothetical protein
VWSSVTCLPVPHLPKLSYKRQDFRGGGRIINAKCVLILSKTSAWNIHHTIKNTARYYQKYIYIGLHVRCQLFFSYFNETWIFWTEFQKILKHQISLRSVQGEPSCFMRTDGLADMKEITATSRNLANSPKNINGPGWRNAWSVFYTSTRQRDGLHMYVNNVYWLTTIRLCSWSMDRTNHTSHPPAGQLPRRVNTVSCPPSIRYWNTHQTTGLVSSWPLTRCLPVPTNTLVERQ